MFTKKQEKGQQELKKANSPIPTITVKGIIGSDEYKEGLTCTCTLPDKRVLCVDRRGFVFEIDPSLRSRPRKLDIGAHATKINYLTENKVIIMDRKADAALLFNVDTGEKQPLDEVFASEEICFAKLKLQDDEYLFVSHTGSRKIYIFEMQRLDKPLEIMKMSFAVNNLTIVGDKVVATASNWRRVEFMLSSRAADQFHHRSFEQSAGSHRPFIYGNGNFVAVVDRVKDVHEPDSLSICTINEDPGPRVRLLQSLFTIDIKLGGIDRKAISAIPGTPLFCFINSQTEELNIFNCETKQCVSTPLPIRYKSSLTLSPDGYLSYISNDDRLVVSRYPLSSLTRMYLLEQLLGVNLKMDPAQLILSFLTPVELTIEPTLTKDAVLTAMTVARIKHDSETGDLQEIKHDKDTKLASSSLFSHSKKSKEELSDTSSAITAMLKTDNDAQRYRLALDFASRHRENTFAIALATVLPTFEPEESFKPKSKR